MLKLFVITLCLAATAAIATEYQVFTGSWKNGMNVEWICPVGTKGFIPFRLTMPDGNTFSGKFSCGEPV